MLSLNWTSKFNLLKLKPKGKVIEQWGDKPVDSGNVCLFLFVGFVAARALKLSNMH